MHEADKATTTGWRLAGVAAVLALCAGGAGASGQAPSAAAIDAGQSLVKTTCVGCHSDRTRSGGLSLQSFDLATAGEHSETAEKMIRKLRAGQMPPPGGRRPDEAALASLASVLEQQADARAAASSASTAPNTPARSAICWRSTSTPATTCRSTRRAPTSTTLPTRSSCRRR